MKKEYRIPIIVIVCICIIIGCYFAFHNNIGVSKGQIEVRAEKELLIPEGWSHVMDTGDELSVLLFYPEDLSDVTFLTYCKHSGFSFGYFFRSGGGSVDIQNGIVKFENESECAYASLNKVGACKLVLDDGNDISTVALDSNTPFVFVLPSNLASVVFYNSNDEVIDVISRNA